MKFMWKAVAVFVAIVFILYHVSFYAFITITDPNKKNFEYFDWVYYFLNHGKVFIFNFYLFYIFVVSAFFSILLWVKIYKSGDIDE